MTRKLPWKRNSPGHPAPAQRRPVGASNLDTPQASSSTPPDGSASKAKSASSSDRKVASRLSLTAKKGRSPSTSPPPEPPTESFMIEGVDNDDQWRMVEDEFLSVASHFTAHLHAAEYHRLKHLARSQNAETIKYISRPITGSMTALVKRRHDALDKASRQRDGIKRSLVNMKPEENDSEEENETPWAGTSLQGLMDSPRKKAMPLTSITSTVSGTKAAAGFVHSSPIRNGGMDRGNGTEPSLTGDDSDEDDDLDGPSSRHKKFMPPGGNDRFSSAATARNITASSVTSRDRPTSTTSGQSTVARKRSDHPQQDDSEDSDSFTFKRRTRVKTDEAKGRGRRADASNGPKAESQREGADAVPSFI